MAIKKKISELPESTDFNGLWTIGVNALNKSVKVSLEYIQTKINSLISSTNTATTAANEAASKALASSTAADESAQTADLATSNANIAIQAAQTATNNANTAAQSANAAATSANSATQAAQTAKTNAETATAQATSAAQAALEAAQACADAVTVTGHVELQSDGAIASMPIYGDVSVTSDNTVKIELVPSTDSLYVKFNRPLEADEYLMLLRRGTNVRGTNWKNGEARGKEHSKLRWHIYPAVLTIGTGEYEGEIGLDDVELITGVAKPINQSPTRWIAKTLAESGTYAGVIYKCHNSREIVVPGWTKSVKFGLAVYKGKLAGTSWPLKQPLKRISEVAFFYSTCLFEYNRVFVQHYSLVDETKKTEPLE